MIILSPILLIFEKVKPVTNDFNPISIFDTFCHDNKYQGAFLCAMTISIMTLNTMTISVTDKACHSA